MATCVEVTEANAEQFEHMDMALSSGDDDECDIDCPDPDTDSDEDGDDSQMEEMRMIIGYLEGRWHCDMAELSLLLRFSETEYATSSFLACMVA